MSVLDSVVLQTPSLVTLLGTVVFLLLLYLLSCSSQEQRKEPPGPRPLPLLGNLLMLDLSRPYHGLFEVSKKYGSVFTVHFGPRKVVVLAGYKTVKQALVNHAEQFGDRDITPIFQDLTKGHGIMFANGDSWKEMRGFALSTLRDFGMGKKMSEEKIIEECGNLIEVFEKHEGKAFDTTWPMHHAVSNIMATILHGNRFEYADPKFKGLVDRIYETYSLLGTPSIQLYNSFPWMGPLLGNWRRLMKLGDINNEVIKALISGLKETLNPQLCRGFVDCFLARQQHLEVSKPESRHIMKESERVASFYHDANMACSEANLFAAGTINTGTTLRWGLLLMAKYPHIQDRVQEEISSVIGSRQVLVEDRKNLPYTDAVIHETQRLANIVPMSIPHVTSRDVTFQGYFIKKGTPVIPLLTSVLQDESKWESPYTFHPAHFLDDKGKFVKRDAFLPFSAGRRVCLGEGLARMELFLFFTSLLQHFRFSPPPGVTEDDLDLTPAVGFILNPSPHKLCAVSRV